MTDWSTLVEKKQAYRLAQIPEEWRLQEEILNQISPSSDFRPLPWLAQTSQLSEKEHRITEDFTAEELCHEIAVGNFNAVGVCQAFCHRAAIAQQLTNLFFTKNILLAKPWTKDSTALGPAWRDVAHRPTLNIGVLMDDADFPVNKCVLRTMRTALEKLQQAGHHVKVLSDFPPLLESTKIAAKFFMLDNKHTALQHVKAGGEDLIKALDYTSSTRVIEARTYTIDDVWQASLELQQFRHKVFEVWQGSGVDVILCPVMATPAALHDSYHMPAYTLIWNLLDFPASVIPYLKSDTTKDLDGSISSKTQLSYEVPSGFQVVGWRHQDEEVLQATQIIDRALR